MKGGNREEGRSSMGKECTRKEYLEQNRGGLYPRMGWIRKHQLAKE